MESSKVLLKYMILFQIPNKHYTPSVKEEAQELNGSLTLVDRAGKFVNLIRH